MAQELTANFGANSTKFSKGVQEIKAQLTELNKALELNKQAIADTNKKAKEYEKELDQLKTAEKESGTVTKEQKARMSELEKEIDKARTRAAQLKAEQVDLKTELKETTSELKKQKSGVSGISNEMDKLKTMVTGFIAAYGGKKLWEMLIGSNAEMEQYTTSLEVMLGSTEKASAMIEKMREFAAKTPLTLDNVISSGTMLMSYGVDEDNLLDTMTKLGDLASGNAEKMDRITLAYGQMLAKGKVTGEELRQMAEAGVPLQTALAESIGVTGEEFSKMVSKGEVGIDALNKAITELTTGDGKFAGMMEKQSQTMQGMLSTLQDNISEFFRKMGEGAFGEVKSALQDVSDQLAEWEQDGTLDEWAQNLGILLKNLVAFMKQAISVGFRFKEVILAGAVALGTFKVAVGMGNVISATVAAIKSFSAATEVATAKQATFNAVGAANPYVFIASAVLTVVAGIATYAATTISTLQKLQKEDYQTVAEVMPEEINRNGTFREKANWFEEYVDFLNKTNSINENNVESYNKIVEQWKFYIEKADELDNAQKVLSETTENNTQKTNENNDSKYNNIKTTEELTDSTADLIKNLDELASAYAEQGKNGNADIYPPASLFLSGASKMMLHKYIPVESKKQGYYYGSVASDIICDTVKYCSSVPEFPESYIVIPNWYSSASASATVTSNAAFELTKPTINNDESTFTVKVVCKELNFSSSVYSATNFYNTTIYLKWNNIKEPTDKFPNGYITCEVRLYYCDTSGTPQDRRVRSGCIPFASKAEYNAAICLTATELSTFDLSEEKYTLLVPNSLCLLSGKLPSTELAEEGMIYLIPNENNTAFKQYMWNGTEYKYVGETDHKADLSEYLKSTDISAWAKAATKPTYTAKEVGAATAADIAAAVNAVSIGGRNIVTGTADVVIGYGGHSKGHWRKYGTAGTIQTVDITNTPISCVSKGIRLTSTDENSQIICGQDDIPLNSGMIYTFSCWIRSNSAEGVPCRLQPFYKSTADHSGNTQDIIISDEWQYISFTAKFSPQSTGTYSGARIYLQPTAVGNYIEVCAMKLEAGNKPTDWSPALEDTERRITSLEARVAALEAAAVSGGEV